MLDMKKYAALTRQVVAEGCVLLRNENHTLPLRKGAKVASFGRSQLCYYKSGTGSGGRVNTEYVVTVLDALKACPDLVLDQSLLNMYEAWHKANPYDGGNGWAKEPWAQEEMPLTEDIVQAAAARNDTALITLGRTAGEDRDNHAGAGSYCLTPEEETMIRLVCRYFDKTVVLLNVGNIIDMKWVEKYHPAAVMYVWQGGQEGGNGVLDVLTGAVNPCGRLTDTVAWDISDYPSTKNFGDVKENIYAEDIYVGYRYFETFAKDRVLYPFGFGLSYTTFQRQVTSFAWTGYGAAVQVEVTNTGDVPGKDVVQLYVQAPQGALGKPARMLAAFAKTNELAPGESEILTLSCSEYTLSSFDDSGASGYPSAYVMEQGTYTFYMGADVRSACPCGTVTLEHTVVTEQLSPALSPVKPFQRLRPAAGENGFVPAYEDVPLRKYDLWQRITAHRPAEIPYTGDRGDKLSDVKTGKITMDEFIAQIPEEELCILLRGEGMCSPRVTPGTGGAFGGVSDGLAHFGIPVACCTDGPSGLRMDVGTIAMSLPNGTCLACTFNEKLSEELFACVGLEMRKNRIDALLGPGMNLHRSPLNGRNFEYFSEDPMVTGRMAAAQLRGMHRHGVTGTIKHFCANNQETQRYNTNSVVSERALRELYLKSFEIACKQGGAFTVMSTYGPINGLWTAGSYDLLTHVLREEWGFDGLVMTDWWAQANEEGAPGSKREFAAMVRSQNDLYMVTGEPAANSNNDNLAQSLHTEKLTLGELQRSAANVLNVILRLPVMDRYMDNESPAYAELHKASQVEFSAQILAQVDLRRTDSFPLEGLRTDKGTRVAYQVRLPAPGRYILLVELRAVTDNPLAQLPMTILRSGEPRGVITLTGADTAYRTVEVRLQSSHTDSVQIAMFFGESGLDIRSIRMKREET